MIREKLLQNVIHTNNLGAFEARVKLICPFDIS